MGKGDKKTKKGKIARGSYGKTRKRKTSAPIIASTKPKKKVAPKKEEKKGLWTIFFLAFIGGFAALLTPCVFPMIPMTVSFFTKQS